MSALYLELLSDADLATLAAIAEESVDLRRDPMRIETLLSRSDVFEAFFGQHSREELVVVSPHLAFALLVARLAGDLATAAFVDEWIGPGQRVPVFDVQSLRDFVAPLDRRLFLVELLASYTRNASGSVWIRAGHGWRRQRYSDVDPMRLAGLLEVVPANERVAVLRRLGDLSLFLAGVFPDHAARHGLSSRQLERIRRVLGTERALGRLAAASLSGNGVLTLEWLGSVSYRLANEALMPPRSALLATFAERFADARRVLNVLTDRYLFTQRGRMFGAA